MALLRASLAKMSCTLSTSSAIAHFEANWRRSEWQGRLSSADVSDDAPIPDKSEQRTKCVVQGLTCVDGTGKQRVAMGLAMSKASRHHEQEALRAAPAEGQQAPRQIFK